MELIVCVVDWEEAKRRFQDGTLESSWNEAMNDGEEWIEYLELESDSHYDYTYVAEAYQELKKGLSFDLRTKADAFFGPLITFEGYRMDLGDNGSLFAVSLNPQSVAELAGLARSIAFAEFRKAFEEHCTDEVKEELSDHSGGDLNESFGDGFLPYVEMWGNILTDAEEEGKGIVVAWS